MVQALPPIRSLLPHLLGADPGCISNPHFMAHLRQQVHKPMAVARRLQPHTYWPAELTVKPFRLSVTVRQLAFLHFSCFRIDPSDLLKTGMIITTYNVHL